MTLEEQADKFMCDYDFERVIWDGRELTVENEDGVVYNRYVFPEGYNSREDFDKLEAEALDQHGGEVWEYELYQGPVAQLGSEPATYNCEVVGSNPTWSTIEGWCSGSTAGFGPARGGFDSSSLCQGDNLVIKQNDENQCNQERKVDPNW